MTTVAGIRGHAEAYKTWLAGCGRYRKKNQVSKSTIGMRMGHLSAFFNRIIELASPQR